MDRGRLGSHRRSTEHDLPSSPAARSPKWRSTLVTAWELLLIVLAVLTVFVMVSGDGASSRSRVGGPTTPVAAAVPLAPDLSSGRRPAAPRASATTPSPSIPSGSTLPRPSGATITDDATIGASGSHLTLNGQIHNFVGVNAYEIGTDWGVNAGCGGMETDAQLDQLFSSLPPDSLVRFWAFQGSIATDESTDQIDWAPLDRVFASAAHYNQKLIVVLTDQGGTCDNTHWQDPSWYEGGFMDVFNASSTTDHLRLTPLSYWNYLKLIVARYRDSPALGMWEPISEPEASTCPAQDQPLHCSGNQTCPDESVAAQALRHFFDVVGGEIHMLDPNHLVESGTLGGGECGTSGSDYAYVSASPGIDVLSYHDYYGAAVIGGVQGNGIAVRIAQAAALGKPIIAGELGIKAGNAPHCPSLALRSAEIAAKIKAQLADGASAVLPWDWYPAATSSCDYTFSPGDPLMNVLSQPATLIGPSA